MPQDPQEFASKSKEWSRWKHEILERYLGIFTGKLQGFQTVYFIDGFAGAGKYRDGTKGSPLRSAQLAQRIAQDRWYQLHCINVEADPEVFKMLEMSTAAYDKFVTNYSGNFVDHIPQILSDVKQQPALFFIDPFGFKDVEWQNLLPLFERKPDVHRYTVTEILLRFDAPYLGRYSGSVGVNNPQAKANERILFELFGIKNRTEWDEIIPATGKRYEDLAQAYQDRLRLYFKYVVRMPIRSRDNRLKYYLIFATRHEAAITGMNEVLYDVEGMRSTAIYEETSQKNQQLSLFGEDENQLLDENQIWRELETLKKLIVQSVPVGSQISRSALITIIAAQSNYFGAFSKAHFTAVLGGRSRKITIPQNFVSLKDHFKLDGTPSEDRTIITRIK